MVVSKSSRGFHILKAIVKQKTESMDTNQKQNSENEEVISPEVRVGPARKEKHSVSVLCFEVLEVFSISFRFLYSDIVNFVSEILQDYILTKHANLRNYVCIGNEDSNEFDIDDIYGRQKGTYIGVEYVWFKMKANIQLPCTEMSIHLILKS